MKRVKDSVFVIWSKNLNFFLLGVLRGYFHFAFFLWEKVSGSNKGNVTGKYLPFILFLCLHFFTLFLLPLLFIFDFFLLWKKKEIRLKYALKNSYQRNFYSMIFPPRERDPTYFRTHHPPPLPKKKLLLTVVAYAPDIY